MAGPADDNQEDTVKEAVRRYVDACLGGDKPDPGEFIKQYPGLESQIRTGIQELQRINGLFDSLAKADASDFDSADPGYDLVGRTIGNFEIVEMIGRGGMGIVYLAHDTKLKRSVAVKSIPAALAGDSITRTRFRREAELLASLNHPNIAVIHEIIEPDDSAVYLVLEYVPGETLTERFAHEPLTLEEALSIGRQIAESISAAHQRGVIHRDLKPGNIKITPEGQVKVLDFGLAKSSIRAGEKLEMTTTQPGHILGTPAYMSPEQARGQPTDKRSDIWSFGCVLYQMLANHLPFEGETATDTVANILHTEPDWQALPESTPANIRILLRRCLEKDPMQRLHDIADARIEISETQSGTLEAFALSGQTDAPSRLYRRNVMLVALMCLIIGALIGSTWLVSYVRSGVGEPSVVSRLSITLPTDKPLWLAGHWNCPLAIAPDASRLVYVGKKEDRSHQLYVRSLDALKIRPIPGTQDAQRPFFSPDGKRVGFFTPDLKIVSLAGGKPVTLLKDVPATAFGSWAEDGTIVFSPFDGKLGLHRISEEGGKPDILMPSDPQESSVRYPQALPGGKAILYTRLPIEAYPGSARIEVFLPETGERRTVLLNATYAMYISSGHLLLMRDHVLMVAPFDIERLKIMGPSVPLLDDIRPDVSHTTPQIAVSHNGTLVYVSQLSPIRRELVWVDRQGQSVSLGAPVHRYGCVYLSPDESQIALTIDSRVYLYDTLRARLTHLTSEGGSKLQWSPNGAEIAYWSGEGRGVFRKSVGGGDPPERLASEPFLGAYLFPYSWSPDGEFLACTVQQDPNTGDDIWLLPLEGDRIPQALLETKHGEYNPAFSPDGHWLAYVSDESDQSEVYLMSYPDRRQKIPVSSGYDRSRGPVWSHDGRELYYVQGKTMMAVQIGADPEFPVGTPEQLFQLEGTYSAAGNLGRMYDISESGRFLMLKRTVSEDIDIRLICAQNWFEELKRLAPTGKGR